jgi:hypothetical protein
LLIPYLSRIPERKFLRIYYKYDNVFLKYSLLALKNFFLLPTTEVLPVSKSDFTEGGIFYEESPSSWLLVQSRHLKLTTNYAAFVKLLQLSPLLWIFAPLTKFNIAKRAISYLFQFEVPSPEPLYMKPVEANSYASSRSSLSYFIRRVRYFVVQIAVCLFLYICFSWNMGNIGAHSYSTPEALKPLAWSLHLDQSW